jgi:hypothetical protein
MVSVIGLVFSLPGNGVVPNLPEEDAQHLSFSCEPGPDHEQSTWYW